MSARRPVRPGRQTAAPPTPIVTRDEEGTREVGRALAARLLPAGALLLRGDLGAGKTVLAQGVAAGLGIDPAEVQSPTYTLIREHRGPRGRLVHVDLYRLDPAEALDLGLDEILAGPGVKVVEWAERLPFAVPGAVRIHLSRREDGGREIAEQIANGGAARGPGGKPPIAARDPGGRGSKRTGREATGRGQRAGRGRPSPPLREGEGSGE